MLYLGTWDFACTSIFKLLFLSVGMRDSESISHLSRVSEVAHNLEQFHSACLLFLLSLKREQVFIPITMLMSMRPVCTQTSDQMN